MKVASATLTVEAKWTEVFSIRLDNRGDIVLDGEPSTALFQHGPRSLTETQWTSTLGVVAVTN